MEYMTLVIFTLLVSCLIFGCEFGEENGVPYFQWGFYHYKKKNGDKL